MFFLFSLVKLLVIVLSAASLCFGLYLIVTSPEVAILSPGLEVTDILKINAGPLPVGLVFVAVGAIGAFLAANWRLEGVVKGPDGRVYSAVRGDSK